MVNSYSDGTVLDDVFKFVVVIRVIFNFIMIGVETVAVYSRGNKKLPQIPVNLPQSIFNNAWN